MNNLVGMDSERFMNGFCLMKVVDHQQQEWLKLRKAIGCSVIKTASPLVDRQPMVVVGLFMAATNHGVWKTHRLFLFVAEKKSHPALDQVTVEKSIQPPSW